MDNLDDRVVRGFGEEWTRFDQSELHDHEGTVLFDSYFRLFPWNRVPSSSIGYDLGCGSGRWAARVAPRVGTLHCIDASEQALNVARRNLARQPNCVFHQASVDAIPLPDGSFDFGYSLGVLHHVPDTADALRSCASKLRPGAPFLVYLYYSLENRPGWYRAIWRTSDVLRRLISRLPHRARFALSEMIAALVYWPLARSAALLERLGWQVHGFPLSYYRHRSYYVMRTDALDRFGTRLEKRFTKGEIAQMMRDAGFRDIEFNENPPYWCAVGIKAS